jgi:DNA-binding NtrC family response regulator
MKAKILVVDDDIGMVVTILDILEMHGYEAESAYSASAAIHKVQEWEFDCVLSDIRMPNGSGVSLFQQIKLHRPDLPVILMTAFASKELVDEGILEGAVAVLKKPLNIESLLSFLNDLTGTQSVIILDDDPDFAHSLRDGLDFSGFAADEAIRVEDVFGLLHSNEQILLLDMKLDGQDGLDVLQALQDKIPDLSVILITGYEKEMNESVQAALQVGAVSCMVKPIDMEQLIHQLESIRMKRLAGLLQGKL